MKIGIITLHYALNAGAVLQAFALQTYLKSLGHEVEFIDYVPKHQYSLRSFIAKSPYVMYNKWKDIYYGEKYTRKKNFNKVLKRGNTRYFSEEQLATNPPLYDLYITGSDQVWNFMRKLFPAYLLSFAPQGSRKIAYAASMGQGNIPIELHNELRKQLSDFEAISVRESNGVNFISQLLGKSHNVIQVADPTFLLQAASYNSIMEKITPPKAYICSYILCNIEKAHSQIIKTLQAIHNDAALINLRNPDTCIRLPNAKNKIVTPYEWLSYIKQAEFVICGSFYAVVFSLLFHKPFIVLQPSYIEKAGGNQRIYSLLNPLKLTDRCFSEFNYNAINSLLSTNINWQDVDKELKLQKEKSKHFLLEILT